MQQGRSAQEIVQALQDDYVLTDEDAMPVLLGFVDELQQEGLVHPNARRG